jgi:hypothetical protein
VVSKFLLFDISLKKFFDLNEEHYTIVEEAMSKMKRSTPFSSGEADQGWNPSFT